MAAEQDIVAPSYPKQRHNLTVIGIDYVLFALGYGFLSPNIILPAFASELGASEAAIGAIVTILMMMWSVPQVIAGNISARQEHKKPLLMKVILFGRPFTLVVPFVIALTKGDPAWLNLGIIIVAYGIFFGTDAFATIPWLDIVRRAFPPEKRGRYVASWQVAKAIALLGASAAVSYLLGGNGPSFPTNYAVIFGAVSACLGVSIGLTSLFVELPNQGDEPPTMHVAWRDFGPYLTRMWRADRRLRLVTMVRILFTLSQMAFPFYILYARSELGFPAATLGLFILAQTVGMSLASVVLGRLADRCGAQQAIRVGTALVGTAPLLALGLSVLGVGAGSVARYAFVWVYVCIGLADNLVMLAFLNYLFDAALPGQNTIYMGAFNTLNCVGLLGPALGGWLLGRTSYPVLFAGALALAAGASILALRLPHVRETGTGRTLWVEEIRPGAD
jgi:MFS family permease